MPGQRGWLKIERLLAMSEIDADEPYAFYHEEKPACIWTYDDIDSCWNTACGQAFCFSDEGPEKNGFKFCYACGLLIQVVCPPRCAGWTSGFVCGNECDPGKLCDHCDDTRREDEKQKANDAYYREYGHAAPDEITYPHLRDKNLRLRLKVHRGFNELNF